MKNIILCSDGTGNRDVKGRGTNVFKLFEAIDLNEHRTNLDYDAQLAFYDDGVGTRGNPIVRAVGGAVGYGLKRNVKELYRELVRVYDPGDQIFLFGFSRGAFTVRTLAGMIGACGVLKNEFCTARDLRNAVEDVYNAYRAQYHSRLMNCVGFFRRWPDGKTALDELRARHKLKLYENVPIKFIGVWDTVDAVGLPFAIADLINEHIYQFKFPACTLGEHVEKACQALSIDDPRIAFQPVLWKGPCDRVEQVWFAGVHSNVGGGYPKQGLSLVPLDWMLAHAEAAGLRLQQADREIFRGHATVDDLIYNPRAGWGCFYRWGLRDVRKYCVDNGIEPRIHLSVAERLAHGTDDYAPGNIPPNVKVATTPADKFAPGRHGKDVLLRSQAVTIEQALRDAFGGRYLLDCVPDAIFKGAISHILFVLASALSLASLGLASAAALGSAPWALRGCVALATIATAAFAGAVLLARAVDRVLDDKFSAFWQKHQPRLRKALKHCKSDARREPALVRRKSA